MSDSATPLRVGLLGAGWFGREAHLRNLLSISGVEVVAASSRSQSSLEAARAIAGGSLRTFHDWEKVLELELDAVIVALTNDQHCRATMEALSRDMHVLCEKPLALTLADCDRMIALADERQRVLQVGHEMRFQSLYRHMKQMIERGDVGTLRLMWCREYRGPMRPGWRSSEKLTGGTLLEKNSHHFDLFCWFLGPGPKRVLATGGRDVLLDREVLDNVQVLIEFEGGRRAMLELCLFAPYGGDTEIGVVGDGGRIDSWNQAQRLVHHRFDLPERMELATADSAEEAGFRDASGRIDRGILAELKHFVDCCRNGSTPLTDARSARLSVALGLAAQESIRRQEGVWLEELSACG